MQFIDSHTHLYLKQFEQDRDEVIESAIKLGIEKMVLPNIDSNSIQPILKICQQYPNHCFPTLGLHPSSVNKNYKKELKIIEDWIKEVEICAIGEIGIDLYWDKTNIEEQKEALKSQIKITIKNDLPIIIHSRESFNEIIDVLDTFKSEKLTGIFHCFTGTIEQAEIIISRGFSLGIGGVVTFKNSGLDNTLKNIDISHIILETDSPYLAPVPKRGQRNESSYLVHIAKKIAEIKSMTIKEVAEITTQNALQLFRI
ncbi:TatD family hydrolase [Bacteroidota bacterium]